MATPLRLPAPAKLNLMLHVTGRRDDGYHLLQSVFQFVDLCDWLEFESTADNALVRLGDSPVPEETDLVMRAARLLQQAGGADKGAKIRVDKQIPMGGGLGGGSSDAATCLLALNHLWGLELPLDRLAELGLELGADVPVFVKGCAAWAGGVGELLEPVDLDEAIYVIIDPAVSVSTAEIFAAEELTRNCDPITIRAFLRGAGTNVCETVVSGRYPEVGAALDWLRQYGNARMSGTGGCVFVEVDSLRQAEIVKSRVPKPWEGYIARSMNRHPLHQQLGLLD